MKRQGLIFWLLILIALGLLVLAAPPGFSITRDEVIARAQTWVAVPVPYSQTSYYNGYRQDCSGYVSMCWATTNSQGAPKSYLANTNSLGGIITFIGKDDLKPGDALLNNGVHILLFDRWANDAHTQYWAYEQGGSPTYTQHRIIPYPYWSGWSPEKYVPIRYAGIEDGPRWSGALDSPQPYTTIPHNTTITGWAREETGSYPVQWVKVYVNDKFVGNADYGIYRSDLGGNYGYKLDCDLSEFIGQEVIVLVVAGNGSQSFYKSASYVRVAPVWLGSLETPQPYTTIPHNTTITGWAREETGLYPVQWVKVYVNDKFMGNAQYGISRPDLGGNYGYKLDCDLSEFIGQQVIVLVVAGNGTDSFYKSASYVRIAPVWSGSLETPQPYTTINHNNATITGWAREETGLYPVQWVKVYANDKFMGNAQYGISRPDLGGNYGYSLPNCDLSEFIGKEVIVLVVAGNGTDSFYKSSSYVRVAPIWQGSLDAPQPNTTVSHNTTITGWAKEETGLYPVQWVEIFVNDKYMGDAQYGLSRLDQGGNYGYSLDCDLSEWAGQEVTVLARAGNGPGSYPRPGATAHTFDRSSSHVSVQPLPHTLSVNATADPSSIASGDMTQLRATATDSQGHDIASWAWSDNGAGGVFSPSANVQDPGWTAPGNTGSDFVVRLLTVTAICDGSEPVSNSAEVYVTEEPQPQQCRLTITCSPSDAGTATGGGTYPRDTEVTISASSNEHWQFSGWYGGNVANLFAQTTTIIMNGNQHLEAIFDPVWYPAYVYAEPSEGGIVEILSHSRLGEYPNGSSVDISASPNEGWHFDYWEGNVTDSTSATTSLTIDGPTTAIAHFSQVHALTIIASADPTTMPAGGTTQLNAFATDNLDHTVSSWSWSDNGAGGIFSPSADMPNPTWTPPLNRNGEEVQAKLTVTATCDGSPRTSDSADVFVTIEPLSDIGSEIQSAGIYQFSLPVNDPSRYGKQWTLRDCISNPDVVVDQMDATTGRTYQIWTWSAPAQAFVYGALDDLLNPGQAYFMEVSAPCSLIAEGTEIVLNKDVCLGWNLIGAPAESTDIASVLGKVRATSGLWIWDDTVPGYILTNTLNPFNGYWLQVSLGGTLGFPQTSGSLNQSNKLPPVGPALTGFSDVSTTDWAHEAINEMLWLGITGGSSNDAKPNKIGKVSKKMTFGSTGTITRAQMALFLTRAFNLDLPEGPVARFTDVKTTDGANRYIEAVYQAGIMGAYSVTTKGSKFSPKTKVTRAQFSVMLARATGSSLPDPVIQVYTDVPTTLSGAAEIEALKALGVFEGQPGLTTQFRPTAYLTRAEMALYLDNLLNLKL